MKVNVSNKWKKIPLSWTSDLNVGVVVTFAEENLM